MNSKVRNALLFVVLFVIASSSLFAQSRVFNETHIAVTLDNAGPGGIHHAIINSVVKVVLTDPVFGDPAAVETASVDFTQFGGPAVVNMVQDSGVGVWRAQYTVLPGTLNGTTAKVKVKAAAFNGNEQTTMDDEEFIVNNISAVLGNLGVVATIIDPGLTGKAIVGSTIKVEFDAANISSASANFTNFGGGVVPMVQSGTVFSASYTVTAGTILGSFAVPVVAYETGNPNPGTANSNNNVEIDNILPELADVATPAPYLAVNGVAGATFKIGDSIQVKAQFNTRITKVWINWGLTFTGGTTEEYNVVNGELRNATYTPSNGSLAYSPDLVINIVKLQTAAGNISDPTLTIAVSKDNLGNPIIADLLPPVLVNTDEDLFFDNTASGWLRFSPSSPTVAGYADTPDHVNLMLKLNNWNQPGNLYGLQLRFEAERSLYYRDFQQGDAALSFDNITKILTISWDGKDNLGHSLTDGTYGVTLWKVWDQVGNTITLGNNYHIGNEYPEAASLLDGNGNPQAMLNRAHVVVDNAPMAFVGTNNHTVNGELSFTYTKHTDHFVGDVPYADQTTGSWDHAITNSTFSFQAKRSFLVDSNILRHETGKHWTIMEETGTTNTWYWNKDTGAWTSFVGAFDPNVTAKALDFSSPYAINSSIESFSFNALNFQPPATIVQGDYERNFVIKSYLKDNAGNVKESDPIALKVKHVVTETTYTANLALVTDIQITSRHDGGAHSLLAPVDGFGNPNYYLKALPYYPESKDSIDIVVTVNNKAYLKDGNAFSIDLSSLGLGVITKERDNFDVNNKVTITISNADVNTLGHGLAGLWTVGSAGVNHLPVEAISSIMHTDLNYYDHPNISTVNAQFNLIVPTAPTYPSAGTITLGRDAISPGHASWTYNAETNPAHDGILDTTNITISVPSSTYPLVWTLTAKNSNGDIWSKTDNLAENVSLPSTTYPFAGLTNNLQPLVEKTSVGNINIELKVVATQFADIGYKEVEDQVVSKSLLIDNVNPVVVDGAGYTYNPTTRTVSFATPPVVSNLSTVFEVVLTTNEPLRTTNNNILGDNTTTDPGWSATIVDAAGNSITRLPLALTASVLDVQDLGANTYKVRIEVHNLNTAGENLNPIMVLRLPWDSAGNPGRYNIPAYPFGNDVFSNDSSEISFSFLILNDRPWVSKLEVKHNEARGEVVFNEDGNELSSVQGNIGNAHNVATVKAWISGLNDPNQRAILPNYALDISALPGAVIMNNPPAHSVDGVKKVITWILDLSGVNSVITNNDYPLTVGIQSTEQGSTTPVYYETARSITLKGDAELPAIAGFTYNGLPANEVNAGTSNNIEFSVSDLPSGIWWDDVESITLSFSEPGVVLNGALVFADPLVQGVIDVDNDTPHFVMTYTVRDNVNNEYVVDKYINVIPTPMPSNVQIVGNPAAPAFFKPGVDDIEVTWLVSDYQRAEGITVKLWDRSVNPAVEVASVDLANDVVNHTFVGIDVEHTHELEAEVLANYKMYADIDNAVLSDAANSAFSASMVMADGVDPDGLPVVTVDSAYPAEITIGTTATLEYAFTDANSGADDATATLDFLVDGVLYTTGITMVKNATAPGLASWNVDIDNTIDTSRLVARFSVKDLVDNETVVIRNLNILPLPVVSNLQIMDTSIDNIDPANWFVPGHDLKVSFDLDGHLRTNSLTITLDANGTVIDSYSFAPTEFAANMEHTFVALSGDLDGKVITATISGNVLNYTGLEDNADLLTDIVIDPVTAAPAPINVDTKPVINISFHFSGDLDNEINYLLPNLSQIGSLQLKATVVYPNPLAMLHEPVITLDPAFGSITLSTLIASYVDATDANKKIFVYNVDDLDMLYNSVTLLNEATFQANIVSVYGYNAEEKDHSMLILGKPSFDQYGETEVRRGFADVGRAPNGWFAPEHNLITEYSFVSLMPPATVGIEADFDRITDNVPEAWDAPTTLTHTVSTYTLTDGREVDVYSYLAVWETEPDYASVWNAYADGDAIQIDYRFKAAPLTPYIDNSLVKVDKEVPEYEDSVYEMAVAQGAAAPVYETISTLPGATNYRSINLALDPPAPGTWPADQHVYLKMKVNDGPGVGAGWVNLPVADGWTVSQYATSESGNILTVEWKLSPNSTLDDSSVLNIHLQQVEDKTGHKNYAGLAGAPIHSNLYVANAPTIHIGFNAGSDNGMIARVIAYQKKADPLDTITSPYIMPGQKLGFQLDLETTRAAEVQSIEPLLVQINDPTEVNDGNTNWHDLAKINMADPYKWYLANDVTIAPAPGVSTMGLKYMITYQVNYKDGSTDTKTFTSNWISQDLNDNPLIVIDNNAPAFVVDGVVLKSFASVTDNYVVPGDNVNITIKFNDVHAYNSPATKPIVRIDNLNTFIDGVGATYNVDPANISYDGTQWVAFITGLIAKNNPGINSQVIDIHLTDAVGHTAFANKFVEIAAEGPIVPLIRDAKYFTQLADGSWQEVVVEALTGQSVNARIEVYVDAQYPEYIDAAWITVPAGVNIDIPVTYTIRAAAPGEAGKWVVVFDNVVAHDLVAGDITLTAYTKRIPYSAEIFEHHKDFTTTVDLMDFQANTPLVKGRAVDNTWIDDIISPSNRARIRVDINDMGEDFAALLPIDLSTWVSLESTPAGLFTTIPVPTISGNHSFIWNIPAADIADLGVETASIKITYKNIYGQIRTIEKNFNIDTQAPVLASLELYQGATLKEDNSDGNFFWAGAWDKIRVNFNEMPAVAAGLYGVNVAFEAHPLTYQYNPSQYPDAFNALQSMVISPLNLNADGTGYVDITFAAPYTGTTLPNGRYLIKITGLMDKLGSSVDLPVQYFDYQYEPAAMTIYIDGVANNASINASDAPIAIIANTSSSVAGLQGVEFRLYYDVDNSGTLTEADLAYDLTSHLSTPTDTVFPYDTYWNMNANIYKFVDELAYAGVNYRGFILRVSAITGTRDLYNYDHYIMVTDDVAPIPVPNMTDIVRTFDYVTPANNTLNVNVDFNDIDVVEVKVAVFDASGTEVANSPLTMAITNPALTAHVAWDFDAIGLGNYTTEITAKDFSGNSTTIAGPAISIQNASSTAMANIRLFNRIGINNETEILNDAIFNHNPIDEYLIVEATITNPASPLNPLNGLAQIGFSAEITDVTNGNVVASFNPLVNDDAVQNHNFSAGYIPAHLVTVNGNQATIRLAVANSDILPFLNTGMDHVFKFHAVFIPVASSATIDLPEANRPYTSFRVDQLAPNVVLTNVSATNPVSWATGHQASFEVAGVNPVYDARPEVNTVQLEWYDAVNSIWRNVSSSNSYNAGVWHRNNWNIEGGALNRFLGENYEGAIQVRARATDAQGNEAFSPEITVNVDNKGPETHFSHVQHSVSYPALTNISGLGTIDIVSSGSNGSSNLRLFVAASTVAADAVLPVRVYHQTPDGIWQPALYDHEANNPLNPGLYEFEIPINKLTVGTHRFAAVMADTHGNLEGDLASLTQSHNFALDAAELLQATDLVVNVVSTDDVVATITYPGNMAYVGGLHALVADTNSNASVEYIEFEHYANGNWASIGQVQKANTHTLALELKRSDIPQYDNLPWVPGVHLLSNGVELGEMLYDPATQSWKLSATLTAGTAYAFQYGIDLNNDGFYSTGEPAVAAPNGLGVFTPGLWTMALDTSLYAQGIHQFRAIPKDLSGNLLAHYEAPATQFIIDNVKPIYSGITAVGHIQRVVPGTNVDFVSDINGLLVYADDQVTVEYQYTGQPAGAGIRKWNPVATTNNVGNSYRATWAAVNPIIDNVDNNNNGLVDEAAEADGTFYIRAIAHDKAGNYVMSTEYAIYVDGSAAAMKLAEIAGINMANANYIYNIDPAHPIIQLKATDARTAAEIAAGFDAAATAIFSYRYTDSMSTPYGAYTLIGTANVVSGQAVMDFSGFVEGYYEFMVESLDALGNSTATNTVVIFNDVTGPAIDFVLVGSQNVVNGEYAFAQATNLFQGNLEVQLGSATGVSTVSFEYSTNNLTWNNITTTHTIPANGLVSVPWNYPNLRAPILYLRAIAQDNGGNNMATKTVKLYHDTVAPEAGVVSLTHSVVEGYKVLDKTADLNISLAYSNLNNDGILDVNYVRIRLLDANDNVVLNQARTYTEAGLAETNFQFLAANMQTLANGIYHLQLRLRDFAGNQIDLLPADYQTLYIDTTAPAALSIASTNYVNGEAPYNSTINFRVNYNDLIGLSATDAITATFSYQNATDVVSTYTLGNNPTTGATWIDFAWDPSAAFEQFILNGESAIVANVNVAVRDRLNNANSVASTFTLRYGIPNTTRIMAVTDYMYNISQNPNVPGDEYNARHHYVDWNLATPQVAGYLGTSQSDANRKPLDLYAYVAHLSETPTSVDFQWYNAATNAWVNIATDTVGNAWGFVHPQFLASYQREYSVSWDISGMPTGDYRVKTVSHYPAGNSESEISLHIYNDLLAPNFAIAGATGGSVERGETYRIQPNGFTGNADVALGVAYMYRYVDAANSPTSAWMHFGNANGTFITDWMQNDFSFDWTVYPYYLYNNRVQVVAFALDNWGSTTPLANALPLSQYVNIVNTLAPAISSVKVNWNATQAVGVSHTATMSATINTSSAPEDLVSVEFFHKLDGAADYSSFDMQSGWTPAMMVNNLVVPAIPFHYNSENVAVSGELKVVTTDVFGNTNAMVVNLNTKPAANLVVSHEGVALANELERGSTVVLNANPNANITNAQYYWDTVPGAPAGPVLIAAVNANPYTYQWDVPANWTFGDHYQIIAKVNDASGDSFTHVRSFVITDHTTDIVINSVAGIAPTSLGIINGRLHGNIPVKITVNDPAIPRVEFMIRPVAEGAAWESVAFVNVAANPITYVFDALGTLPSGNYYIGVRPAARNGYPVIADEVLVTLDNNIAITVNSFLPATNGYFNGQNFVVNFTVASDDEINETNVSLDYNTATEPTWLGASVASLQSADGIHYVATFASVAVPVDGYYNFRIRIKDSAFPTANESQIAVAQHVLVDTGMPIVAMVSIDGETDLTQPIMNVELGTQVNITASAYDVLGGQIHLIASGIDKVEFLVDGTVMGEVVVRDRSREVYSYVWNTLGYEINSSHSIYARAYDKAGNNVATATYMVNLVAPVGLEAYAMITALDFDANTANNDHIYAVLRDWPATGATPTVSFEYYNGTAWSHFANATNFGAYYRANFNAELMANATALRAVVNGNYAAPMPVLAVSYNAANASLETVAPAINANIFYANELRITENFAATPVVTALQGGAPVISTPYMMNGNQVVNIAINNRGIHTFWAAVLDGNGNVQLGKTVVETVNAGTASNNGISFSVPAGGFGYFQNVSPAIALPEGFAALSPQHAFFAKNSTGTMVNRDLNITINAPAAQGDLVAMYYNAATGVWSAPMPVVNNNNGTVSVANVPSGTIVSVMQYTGVGIHAMFNAISPVYVSANNLWTTSAPTIDFFIYEGIDANGYIIPAALSNLTLYLDQVAVAPTAPYNPATGLVGYSAFGLEAGTHTMRVVAERNGFVATASQSFFVELTAPVIVANGSQITSTQRAITATITDAETGILDVNLYINGTLSIPMNRMTVAGNTYSYNITDEDLFTLGYNFTDAMELSVRWSAKNNLNMFSPAVVVNYTVNITGPGIVFTGFTNGWWINPTQNTPLTFNVIAPQGRVIDDNVVVMLEEVINDPVNGNYTNVIQSMSVNPVNVSGQTYSYSVHFGYLVAPNAHAIRLNVNAWDNYNVQTFAEQTYGIDYLAPIVWAVSPVGAPIDPSAFPVTYESAVIPYGTPVTIAVGFQDMQGFATQETGEWYWVSADDTWHHDYLVYYTGASGLNLANVHVSLDGTPLTNGTISGGAFTAPAGALVPGLHTVVATVADNAGNVGSLSYTFTVTGGTPAITFTGVNGVANDFWLNSTNNNQLGFTVNTVGNVGIDSVIANIYAEPGNFIIQGPITPAPNGNAYTINLLGGIIPAGQYAVRLEVTATTVLGNSATSTQTYGIDNEAPVITLVSPAENSVFAPQALVNILAQISDQVAAKSATLTQSRIIRTDDKAGSGLQSVKLSVFSPSGTDLMANVNIPVAQVIAQSISGAATAELGTYNVVLIATDKAGNQSMLTRSFMVAPTTGPAVSFAEHSGWLVANGMNNLQFAVTGEGNLSVSAKVYANPSDALLMGPLAVQPVSGVYTVSINGNMVPADQNSIRLEVTVNDQYGHVSVANSYYNVDKIAPTITILSPAEGAQITRVDAATMVNIEAQFADLMLGENASAGSGIASSRLVVIGPDGLQIGAAVDTGAGIANTSLQLTDLALGNYTARITVKDNAGNQNVATVNFTVLDVPAPHVALDITEAHIFPNPSDTDTGARFGINVTSGATISIKIYDFAGREVRTMNYAAKANGKSVVNIPFDGRTNDGVKLARGTYFARVIANDGTKTVEKVVKVAIRK